jgi:hypothetical protein
VKSRGKFVIFLFLLIGAHAFAQVVDDEEKKDDQKLRECPIPWEKNAQVVNAHINIQCRKKRRAKATFRQGEANLFKNGDGYFCMVAKTDLKSAAELPQMKKDLLDCVAYAKTLCTPTRIDSAYPKMFGAYCGSNKFSYYWTNLEDLPNGIEATKDDRERLPAEQDEATPARQ